ncbi:MAG: MerR family transcriptional regulator [Nitrospirae bacterium]|nr:MerR family transcriptional regulator [Nitrospirota bacterium]
MAGPTYRISDLALRIDRSPLTIKRWEKKGYIPSVKRDSRGWRIYTAKEINQIIAIVRKTNYFLDKKNYATAHKKKN